MIGKRGLSSWLFSKLVMFSFLVIVFGIMTQMVILLNERAYIDSSSILCLQMKEAAQGVINSRVIEIENVIPFPETLPEKSESAHHYYLVIKKNPSLSNSISFAITKDDSTSILNRMTFSASKLLYLPNNIRTNVDYHPLIADSSNYTYLLIRKNESKLNFYACQKFYYDISAQKNKFKNCVKPGGTIIHDMY